MTCGNPCSGVFRATIGFAAPNFQPSRAGFFLAKITESYFFRHYGIMTAFKSSLGQEEALGAHGNVILVTKCSKPGRWSEKTYVWAHLTQRPWGMDIPQQCDKCGRLRPWKTPDNHKLVKITCSHCGASQEFKKPDDFVLEGTMGGNGQWYHMHRTVQAA